MTTTQETGKKETHIEQREAFKKLKADLLKEIQDHKKEISKLEKDIEESRPITKDGTMICERCDCVSMKYMEGAPKGGLSGGADIYICEICERSNLDNSPWY